MKPSMQQTGRLLALVIATCSLAVHARAQTNKSIPVRQVSGPVTSRETFTERPDVRGIPGGHALVHDQRNKRLLVFDSTLATFTISADSVSTGGNLFPKTTYFYPLIAYAGDSSLLIDSEASAFLVVDGAGRIVHPMAHPIGRDLRNASYGYVGHPAGDQQGRLYYTATSPPQPAPKDGAPPSTATRDTGSIVRVDFNRRVLDTVAQFSIARGDPPMIFGVNANGKPTGITTINPMHGAPDEWAVLADGTLAIVREYDYHVDWVSPDGEKRSTPKLPFDWRRITDDEKRARIDSVQRIIDSVTTATGQPMFRTIRGVAGDDGRTRYDTIIPTVKYVPLSQMPDYFPPIRNGAVRADADNNLWILPTTSSQAGAGLLYDVVDKKGELFERVRLPANSVLAGFGKGGVVFLLNRDPDAKTWELQRTRVVR